MARTNIAADLPSETCRATRYEGQSVLTPRFSAKECWFRPTDQTAGTNTCMTSAVVTELKTSRRHIQNAEGRLVNTTIFKRYGIFGATCLCLLFTSAVTAQDAQEHRRVINVKTVGQLYAAVNNSANRNVTVRLAPGIYLLSSYNKNNVLRRNQGALRMPPGMSLVGSEKRIDVNGDGVPDPISDATPDDFTVPGTETIIDGSALELPGEVRADCAGELFPAPNPVIHVGVNNSISRLTLFAGGNVGISEPTNNPVDPNGNLSMRVTNTVLEGSSLVMGFSNCECAARRARSVLTFSHNVVRGTGFIGVLIQNFLTGDASNDGSDGPAIWATIDSNLFYNNSRALITSGGGRGTDGGSVTLDMSGNVFRNNAVNLQGFAGGSGSNVLSPVIGNRLNVKSENDTFGDALSNVVLAAGPSDIDDNPQDSRLEAKFIRSHFIRDFPESPAEISIVGGGGSHNRAKVLIRGATVKTSEGVRSLGALLIQNESVPGIGTSKARLEGSRQEFIKRNQGLPAPPANFFLEH